MCRWCRKLEPILARESYPFPLHPLTPKLHALHGAASHRLGIFYRNRLMTMEALLELVQPLEKWHLDMGLVEEVKDEIVYLRKGLERHPVERDEERGWEATKERMKNKSGGKGKGNKGKEREREVEEVKHGEDGDDVEDGEEGSEAGSERSRSAVVSGRGRDEDHEEEGQGSARSHVDNEIDVEPYPTDNPSTTSTHAGPAERNTPGTPTPSLPASDPPRTSKPKTKTPHQEHALPRFKLRNPWRAYIEDLVAAKVLEHLEWQKQNGTGVLSLGPTSHGGSLHPIPETAEQEDGPRHAPVAAAGTTGGPVRSEDTLPPKSGVPRPRGKKSEKLVAWVKAVGRKALEPPRPPWASKPSGRKTKTEKAKDRYINGPRAVEVESVRPSVRTGGGSRRGNGGDDGDANEELYGGSGDGDGDGDEHEDEDGPKHEDEHRHGHGGGDVDGDGDEDEHANGEHEHEHEHDGAD